MKVRALKRLLNNTKYIIADHGKYIGVGSPLCHDLIKLDKSMLLLQYALDTRGRAGLEGKEELLFIWDMLELLINSGQIHDIINGRDVIEKPLPVFSVRNGEVIESVTDAYGWPNTDDNGVQMYENTHFPTREQAIRQGMKDAKAAIKFAKEQAKELRKNLKKSRAFITTQQDYMGSLLKDLIAHKTHDTSTTHNSSV